MRIRDPFTEGEEPYNLVPLTDMVFNLLIFFMCATTFVQVERDMALQLPRLGQSASKSQNSGGRNQLVINIRQNGDAVIDGSVYRDDKALSARIVAATTAGSPSKLQTVLIRADERSIVKHFADVTRLCKQAGIKEVKLVYIDPSAGTER